MSVQSLVMTVSQLNKQVKNHLEYEIGLVHVEGEISNLSKPSSGHFYFTLKDDNAQIRCVFFKNRHVKPASNQIGDGQKVVVSGKLSLYEARGDYQLIIEHLTEAGLGKLYQQFEQLKNKLAQEGLFAPERKKAIPKIPHSIGLITSTSGAAIQDILSTLARRFPLATVYIYPCEVQGVNAPQQLIRALQQANTTPCCDVLILARGGGSIEDLWAFNNEQLARQIAASTIPIVSGVGHETDFTIADFVADYRAETPTAAACAVSPNRLELLKMVDNYTARLLSIVNQRLDKLQLKLDYLTQKISSPTQAIITFSQTVDYLERQLNDQLKKIMQRKTYQVNLLLTELNSKNPIHQIARTNERLSQVRMQLMQQINLRMQHYRHQLVNYLTTLHAVSPLATLDRGYAIATKNKSIIFRSDQVMIGDQITIQLAKGTLDCSIIIKDQVKTC